MYCKICGKELPDGTKFCTSCGSAVSENQPGISFESDVIAQPKKSKAGLIALTAGAVGIAAVTIGGIAFVNVQRHRPVPAFFTAGQNLSEDLLAIQSARFSLDAGGQNITGAASVDYDTETLQAYFNTMGMTYAMSYDNGVGYIYMQSAWVTKQLR